MELADLSKPGEKKKLIGAAVLGFVAILFLWWTFVGFGSSKPPATPTPTKVAGGTQQTVGRRQTAPIAPLPTEPESDLTVLQKVSLIASHIEVPGAKRNIFAFYEPPPPAPKAAPSTPTPTPTPPPPVLLASISPSNMYAKTGEFTLEVTGDKFTSEMKIFIDEREQPTKYKGPQQMSATIPASVIATPGIRKVKVRTPDNRAYSNDIGLNVAPPPTPNYAYVGIFGTKHYVGDTALLQDKNNKELLSVQRGDILSGRFRITSISEKEVVFLDTNLKINHKLAMTEGERTPGSPSARPTPRVTDDDDEP